MLRLRCLVLSLVGFGFFSNPTGSFAEELVGAAAVIKDVVGQLDEKQGVESTKDNTEADFVGKVEQFAKRSGDLPSQEAIDQWLALVDEFSQLTAQQRESCQDASGSFGSSKIVAVIPGPKTWPALRKTLDDRQKGEGLQAIREQSLKMIGHVLTGDVSAQQQDLSTIGELVNKLDKDRGYSHSSYYLQELASAFVDLAVDPELSLTILQSRIDQLPEQAVSEMGAERLEIPDLVTLVGEERCEQILRQAMSKNAILEISVGDKTKKLAREVALEMVEELVMPQWSLCESIEAVDLFEALQKRFLQADEKQDGKNKTSGLIGMLSRATGHGQNFSDMRETHEVQVARAYFFIGLIAAGRTEDAVDQAEKMLGKNSSSSYYLSSAISQLRKLGKSEQVYDFFRQQALRHPEDNYWEAYIDIATETGHGDQLLQDIMAAADNPRVEDDQKRVMRSHLRDALLAVGKIEEGIALLREDLGIREESRSEAESDDVDPALKLAELGRLLERPKLIEEGLRVAREALKSIEPGDYNVRHYQSRLTEFLLKIDRFSAAEQLAKQQLIDSIKAEMSSGNSWGSMSYGPYASSRQSVSGLLQLLHIYAKSERHQDVITLLKEAPWWNAKDLSEVFANNSERDVMLDVAAALISLGEPVAARSILREVLFDAIGNDRAYELLVKLDGQDARPLLVQLQQRDQFEERPLIWQAQLLLDAGQLDEAEQMAKQAIAIDPSDGEQGKGDRMRVYAVLADIYDAKGDTEQRDFMRRVVRAIRLAEDADDFYSAGLKSRGIAMYREALLQFADAYCIQSRMAVQLAELGKLEEAAAHYQRAFELMPDSFGRVESHCFGCEGAFTGDVAQSIADKVFSQIAKQNPTKPQVHYLIGYLRSSQDRYLDALPAYERAVQLDPDYLNAWEKIVETGNRVFISREKLDNATFNLCRLDPLGKHVSMRTDEVSDLAKLWEVVAEYQPQRIERQKSLYPLSASRKRLEEVEQALKNANTSVETTPFRSSFGRDPWGEYESSPRTPSGYVSEHRVISALCRLFDEHLEQ